MTVRPRLVIAIDGPAGAGKSSAARRLAGRLGVPYLDTGAMYRAVALHCARQGIDPADERSLVEAMASIDLQLRPNERGAAQVLLNGRALGAEIREPAISDMTSRIAVQPAVRRRLVELQRAFVAEHGGVLEGRDIGTVVVPESRHKFFLEAHPEVRAARRHAELAETGRIVSPATVALEIAERDSRDRARPLSPLAASADACHLDTSTLTLDEVVDAMVAEIERRGR